MSKKTVGLKGYDRRAGSLLLSLVALALAYLLASRAIDTGSWQQYSLALVLLGFAIAKFVKIFQKNNGK